MKIGVIGCGKIAERHVKAYSKLTSQIIVTDAAEGAAQRLADRWGVEFSSSPEKIFNDSTISAVDICIPTSHHKEVILKALEYGKHVFCEKPLCLTVSEAHEIKDAAKSANCLVMVGYLQRFHPAFKFVKNTLMQQAIGEPYLANFRVGGRGDHSIWKHRRETGGGVILEMLVHKLDLLVWFFGPPRNVKVLSYNILRPLRTIQGEKLMANAEDYIVLEIETDKVKILCQGDFVTPGYMDYLEIQGENGSIFSSLLHYFPTIIHCKEPQEGFKENNNFFQFPEVDLFEQELSHFLESLQNGSRKHVNSLNDSIAVMEIIDEIWKQVGANDRKITSPK